MTEKLTESWTLTPEERKQRDAVVEQLPPQSRSRFLEITALTDGVCAELSPIAHEYRMFSWVLTGTLCREQEAGETPLLCDRSQAGSWAAGVLWTLGRINWLTDRSFEPHMTAEELAERCGVSTATMQNKASKIRDYCGITDFDPQWTLPSMAIENPLIWMVEDESGMIFDLREEPREMQVDAYEQGLIPFIPADVYGEDGEDESSVSAGGEAGEPLSDDVIGRIGFH